MWLVWWCVDNNMKVISLCRGWWVRLPLLWPLPSETIIPSPSSYLPHRCSQYKSEICNDTPSLHPLPPLYGFSWAPEIERLPTVLAGLGGAAPLHNLGWTDWMTGWWAGGCKANKWLHDMPGYLRQLAGLACRLRCGLSICVMSCPLSPGYLASLAEY